jgi:Ni/Co efflux regulator RcnB
MFIQQLFHKIPLIVLALLLAASSLQADPPDNKGKSGKAKSEQKAHDDDIDIDIDLSALVTAGISIGDARKLATQHGLTGSKPLPPGIRKNMARGKPMPPGIQKTRMPDSFLGELPRHKGYEWQQAGSDLVLVAAGSLVISDVLEGVFD